MTASFAAATTAAEVLDAFAHHLTEHGWCLDISGFKPRLRNSRSKKVACSEEMSYQFNDWLVTMPAGFFQVPEQFHSSLPSQLARRLHRVYGTSFRPSDEVVFTSQGALVANSYRPFIPAGTACKAGTTLLNDLADRLWPDKSEQKVCLQFLAHTVRHPAERPQWGLLITGEGGCGKSSLICLVEKALGEGVWWHEDSYGKALSRFSEVLPNNLLVTFDDAKGGRDTYEELKAAFTRKSQHVEIKGVQELLLREVYARIVIITNDKEPFDLSEDRRLFVPKPCVHLVDVGESNAFFSRVYEFWADPNCAATVYAWLQAVDLSDFNPGALIVTETHRAMSSAAPDDIDAAVAAYLADGRIVHIAEVEQHLEASGHRSTGQPVIQKALERAKYVQRRRPRWNGKKGHIDLWRPSGPARSRSLTTQEKQRIEAAVVLH